MNWQSRRARIAGVDAYWLEAGAGDPVVLLHGLGASSYSWRRVLPLLAPRFKIYAPDFPGFGRSEAPLDFSYTFAGLSRWLVAFCDHLGLIKTALAGNSMGGVVSLLTALEAAQRVTRLALVGTPTYIERRPIFFAPLSWPLIGGIYEALLAPFAKQAVRLIGATAFRDPAHFTPDAIEEYAMSLRRAGGRRAAADILRNCHPPNAGQLIARYRNLAQPVLVVCGDADGVVDLASARRFSDEVPKGVFFPIEACGHAAQEEKPAVVAKALEDFLIGR